METKFHAEKRDFTRKKNIKIEISRSTSRSLKNNRDFTHKFAFIRVKSRFFAWKSSCVFVFRDNGRRRRPSGNAVVTFSSEPDAMKALVEMNRTFT